MSRADDPYPAAAFSPDGILWWRLKVAPGSKKRRFGDEQKIAAYLAFVIGQDGVFTMRSLRSALGEETIPNNAEHLNRRLRTLRTRDGWLIASGKDDASLQHDQYRVQKIGWHPGLGVERAASDKPSEATRRRVLERDKYTCLICGVARDEEYADLPGRRSRMTLGHRVPGKRADSKATADDLQAECARCNEVIRDELFDPVTLKQVMPRVRTLSRKEKADILDWLEGGRRPTTRAEQVFADARRLTPPERNELMRQLKTMTGH